MSADDLLRDLTDPVLTQDLASAAYAYVLAESEWLAEEAESGSEHAAKLLAVAAEVNDRLSRLMQQRTDETFHDIVDPDP
jgi:hypothetical protein